MSAISFKSESKRSAKERPYEQENPLTYFIIPSFPFFICLLAISNGGFLSRGLPTSVCYFFVGTCHGMSLRRTGNLLVLCRGSKF